MSPRGSMAAAVLTVVAAAGAARAAERSADSTPELRLGARLFHDDRFTSPNGDFPSSCSHCHKLDEDPQGLRAYTDFLARSWMAWRSNDPRRDSLRNAPTLLDAADMSRLHYDGEFDSLPALVKGTLAGRTLGWLPGEQGQAFAAIARVLKSDTGEGLGPGGSYRDQFEAAYGADLEELGPEAEVDLAVRAISRYVGTLHARRNSPYDAFVVANHLEQGPAAGESPAAFSARMLAAIARREAQHRLERPAGFGPQALAGLEVFLRTQGPASVGNCVSCHPPPLFTDSSFHNLGVSQAEYDRVHGAGSFARITVPEAAHAQRPSACFRETPSRDKPGCADLGYWNFADLARSPLRQPGESDDRFLARMIATFKTPTLRNLGFSQPYLHNGSLPTVESVVSQLMQWSAAARAGHLRSADGELSRIQLTPADVPRLAAFLRSLNEDLMAGPRRAEASPRY